MSRYLVDRVTAHPKITVLTGTRVIAAGGSARLETVTVADRDGHRRELHADAMYVLIGGQPLTAGVEGWLRRDEARLPHHRRGPSPRQPDGVVAAGARPAAARVKPARSCSSLAMSATAPSSASPPPWEKARWRSRYCTPTSPNTSTIARRGPTPAGSTFCPSTPTPSALLRVADPPGIGGLNIPGSIRRQCARVMASVAGQKPARGTACHSSRFSQDRGMPKRTNSGSTRRGLTAGQARPRWASTTAR